MVAWLWQMESWQNFVMCQFVYVLNTKVAEIDVSPTTALTVLQNAKIDLL